MSAKPSEKHIKARLFKWLKNSGTKKKIGVTRDKETRGETLIDFLRNVCTCYFMCTRVLPACTHVYCALHSAQQSRSPETGVAVSGSHYVGAGNRSQVPCRSHRAISSAPRITLLTSLTITEAKRQQHYTFATTAGKALK